MQQMYEPPKIDPSQIPEASPAQHANDLTDKFVKLLGIGLLVAFFFPMYAGGLGGGKLLFINFQMISTTGVSPSLKFQALYPLLAGIMVLVLSGKDRSSGKGWALMAIGFFPALILLISRPVQQALANMSKGMPGSGVLGLQVIISTLAIFCILSGAYASWVRPGLGNYNKVAAVGGGLYLLSLLIPNNGVIPVLEPFKMMFGKHFPGMGGMMFTQGLASLAAMVVMSLASVKCLVMRLPHQDPRNQGHTEESTTRSFQKRPSGPAVDHGELGKSALKLWLAQFYIYGAFILYIMFASPTGGMGGSIFMMVIMGVIKFIPWLLGLYLLIPLGIAEIMLAGNEPPPRRVVV